MRRTLPTLLCLSLLAACGGAPESEPAAAADATGPAATAAGEPAEITPDDPAAAAGPPMPAGDFRVIAVELDDAVDGEGRAVQPTLEFAAGDRIHAAVIGIGSSDGLTLSARWFGPDGAEIASAGQLLAPEKPTVTTFSIHQPDPWPAGGYRLEVAINQRVVETREFQIR